MAVYSFNPDPVWLRARAARWTPAQILQYLRISQPAIDVFRVARDLGVQVSTRKNPGWSGAVQSSPSGKAIIWLDGGEPTVRQRFTVAHELGHLMLDELGEEFRDASFGGSPKESRANQFAAELLVPLDMLHAQISKHGPNRRVLADVFGVSVPMMDVRMGRWAGI